MHKSNRNRAKTCSSHLYSTEGCSVPLLRQGNMTETLQPTGQQVIKSYPNKKFKNSRKFSSLRGGKGHRRRWQALCVRERERVVYTGSVYKVSYKEFHNNVQQEISCVNSQSAAFSTFEMAKQKLCAWMIQSLASPWTSKAVVLEWISYNPKAMHAMFQVYNASTQLGVSHIFITSRNEHQYRGV